MKINKFFVAFFLPFLSVLLTSDANAQVHKTPNSEARSKKAKNPKFGALAIDRSNGFFYGWSVDYATLESAEKKAIDECNSKGGKCSIVLSFSGSGCAAYRTVDGNVGTAYGWGLGKTKEEADAIALAECAKRSNGKAGSNYVWSCNSVSSVNFKEIYNASNEIIQSVKIGKQYWSTENLSVIRFKNGNPIQEAKTKEEWIKFCNEKKPAYLNFLSLPKEFGECGVIYNIYAVIDDRGLCPEGWTVPTENDWKILDNYLGGTPRSAASLANKEWKYTNGNNSSGFNGQPCSFYYSGNKLEDDYGIYGGWWSSSRNTSGSADEYKTFFIRSYGSEIRSEPGSQGMYRGCHVRCIKQ